VGADGWLVTIRPQRIGTFDDAGNDPRVHVASVAALAGAGWVRRLVHCHAVCQRGVDRKLVEQAWSNVHDAHACRRLRVAHVDLPLVAVDVLLVECAQLAHPQAGEAEGREHGSAGPGLFATTA